MLMFLFDCLSSEESRLLSAVDACFEACFLTLGVIKIIKYYDKYDPAQFWVETEVNGSSNRSLLLSSLLVTVTQSEETPTLASFLERQRFSRWKPESELPLTVIKFS